MKLHNRSGFTLLEIIIVVIIIGVLASLALPRLFSTVEYSRSTEALSSFASIRSSLERCYLQKNGTYRGCTLNSMVGSNELDIPDPADSPNAHFDYWVVTGSNAYIILAIRNGVDNGSDDGSDMVGMYVNGSTNTLVRAGKGAYKAIGNSDVDWLVNINSQLPE